VAWGVPATEHMVAIYLAPDNDPLWAERDPDTANDPAALAAITEALGVADKLLAGIPADGRTPYHEVRAGRRCLYSSIELNGHVGDVISWVLLDGVRCCVKSAACDTST